MPDIGPAPVLALVVGVFHTGVYLLLRGSVGLHLPLVLLAAVLGAYAGQALGLRLGDPLRVGDFGLAWASLIAWLGIGLVVAAGILAPDRSRRGAPGGPSRAAVERQSPLEGGKG